MKSFAVPLEDIASPEALLTAWRGYRTSKRSRPAVAFFELDAERRLLELSAAVLGGTYRHRPYRLLEIRDPKPRLIAVATVGDRVVHRSIHDALAPLLNRSFIADSFACLPERGSHRAVWRFAEHLRRYRYLLHLDIASFFPSVDHEVLLDLLAPRLRDPRVMGLAETILASGAALYRRPRVRAFYPPPPELGGAGHPRGLPIGNLTSQWWSNLYLDGLDHFAKRELKIAAYQRYMDDVVCFADEAATLRRWRRAIGSWLFERRRLLLNPRKGHVRSAAQPQTYLGYRISRQGWDLGPKAMARFRKQLPRLARGDPGRLERSLAAWRGVMMS